MSYALLGCQFILTAVLLIAAISKLLYTQQFVVALQGSAIPQFFVFPAVILTIMLEAELSLSLVLSIHGILIYSFAGIFLLLGVFTSWLISVYRRQLDVKCGCFGASHAKVGKGSIIRNLMLIGVSVVGFYLALRTPDILPPLPIWAFAIIVTLIGTAVFILSSRSLFQLKYQSLSRSHFA